MNPVFVLPSLIIVLAFMVALELSYVVQMRRHRERRRFYEQYPNLHPRRPAE